MVFVLVALLFGAIFSRFLGSDMVQTGSINAPKYVFSRIFMQLESKKHAFSRDFGLQISPGSLLGDGYKRIEGDCFRPQGPSTPRA